MALSWDPLSSLLGAAPPPDGLPSWLTWFWDLGTWIVDNVLRALRDEFAPGTLAKWFLFALLLTGFYLLGRFIRFVARRTVLSQGNMDESLSRLLGHFVVLLFVLLGFSAGLTIFGTSLAAIATALGLLSLALGFGMQNTVANLMGGISLAVDKPFRIGDRVQVGEYWGTVQTIGLRSTRIVTPRKETVIIPNKIMEEREIWNYTLSSPEYRLDIDVSISYDSDWRLAERIMLEVADAHPNILHYPPGKVVMRGFGDSGLKLQLRCWIADVTVRADTISDLLKATKDRFDKGGIEIPFPYRTIVYKKEMAKPFSPKEELKPFTRIVEGMQDKILVAVAGPQPVRERASFVASLAKALSAGVVALYINRPGARREQGEDALRIMGDVARNQRIWYKPVVRSGDIVSTIRDVAREEDVDLILVGAGRGSVASLWRRTPEIGSRLRQELSRPVFTVPRDLKLTPQLVAWLMDQIKGFQEQRQQGKAAAAEPKGTLERALADEKPLGPSDSGTARPAASPDAEPPARDEDSSKREDGPSRGP